VHDLCARTLAVQAAGVAGDPGDLCGAGEGDPGGRGDLDEALLGAPVPAATVTGAARAVGPQPLLPGGERPGWLPLTVST